MTRKITASLLVWSWFIAGLLPANVAAQEPQPAAPTAAAPPVEARDRIRVTSNLVVLPVTVKDAKGNLIAGLQRSDFRVFDDGVEQAINVFTAEAFPLSVVVLVDDDLRPNVAEEMVKSLHAVAAGFSTEDETMVCRYDVDFHPGANFVRGVDVIVKELDEAGSHSGPSTAGPVPFVTPPSTHTLGVGEPAQAAKVNLGHAPTKALDDAIYSAAELLRERGRDRRKIVLLLSDGENGAKFNHHDYDDTVKTLLASNISVFSVAVGSLKYRKRFARLAAYASDSGGDIYFAAERDAMEKLYSRITEEARHEYTLAYVPTGNKKNAEYHAVEVQVSRPAVTVKTRKGYGTGAAGQSGQ